MPEVTLTPLAREDIKGIGRYTQRKWGQSKRTLYLTTLDATINELTSTRRLDRDSGDLRPGLLHCFCQEHTIFFRRDDLNNVQILRILGQRMDAKLHI